MAPLRPIGDIATLADTLDISESAAADLVLSSDAVESVGVGEAAGSGLVLAPAASEKAGATPSASVGFALTPGASESLRTSESGSGNLVLRPSAQELIDPGVIEAATTDLVLAPGAAEAAGAAEAGSTDLVLAPGATEAVSSKIKIVDDFEAYSDGSAPGGTWNVAGNTVTDNAKAYSGSLSCYQERSNTDTFSMWSDWGGEPLGNFTIEFKYRETSSNSGFIWVPQTSNGNDILGVGSSNPSFEIVDANGRERVIASPSPNYDEWRQVLVSFNPSSGTFDVEWRDLTGSSSSQIFNDRPLRGSPSDLGRVGVMDRLNGNGAFGPIEDCWIDDASRIN